MKATRRGRAKTGKDLRTHRVICSMLPDDAEWLNQFAKEAGFISRSQLVTCILERLKDCGFSPAGALRMASQIQHRRREHADNQGKNLSADRFDMDSLLRRELRPLPPLPDNAPFDPKAERDAIEELTKNNKPKTV